MRFALVSLGMLLGLVTLVSCGTQPRGMVGLPVPGGDHPLVLGLLPGDARAVLEQAEHFEILSLQPYPPRSDRPAPAFLPERFHDYRVLGRASVPVGARWRLLEALYAGVGESPSLGAGCWEPRHGIHAVRGDRTVDLLICFKCIAVRALGLRVPETERLVSRKRPTTRAPEGVFDGAMKALGLPKSGPWAD